ncbi:hypothetical protein FBUS_10264 [Fasciolopsis buskii]|uniref:Uncharacterized protein n=1 Tax=Fasciolopsis buskii TaxID=27845 RepID=A0A8E0RQJ0_9TREM|nr:hypothetical protein FBUS_10264 [Fasciolopsis buski]
MVYPDVIRRFSRQLNSVCCHSDSGRLLSDMDDAGIRSFAFPPWQYLSDVANATLRPSRFSGATRRSLEVPTKESEPDPTPVASFSDTKLSSNLPRVVLQSINISDLHDLSTVSDYADRVPLVTSPPVFDKENSDPDHLSNRVSDCPVSDPLSSSAGGTPSRKRLTLDNFFTPFSKRPHHQPVTPITDEDGVIVIDSD